MRAMTGVNKKPMRYAMNEPEVNTDIFLMKEPLENKPTFISFISFFKVVLIGTLFQGKENDSKAYIKNFIRFVSFI